jgi:hypothetical protein
VTRGIVLGRRCADLQIQAPGSFLHWVRLSPVEMPAF